MDAVGSLEQAGYGPLAARTLARRGILSAADADEFFTMKPDGLHDPFGLPDMQKAVERLRLAAERGETAAVYGDYDADGITATCMMVRALRELGIGCVWHIPDRESDGYGLNREALEDLRRRGASLIVTVDTGVTAHKEVEMARELGVDVIITDHHECRDDLPGAVAVVNPRRADSEYPFRELAGVGVAFKLVCALSGDWRGSLIKYADIVALGTIADIMPVVGENRLLITQGLRAMAVTRNPGLRALMDETEQSGKPVTADAVAFVLGPRINAAGRVGRAGVALELLLADDPAQAGELARTLCELNTLRQGRENEIVAQAMGMAEPSAPALVLAGEGWPTGVAGIVAARLAEQFERPAFVACLSGELARGSARGVPGIHLAELLHKLSPLLEAYGGHEQAAGFTVRRDNFETFRQAVERECASLRRGETVLEVDAEVSPGWLGLDGLRGLESLAPFGTGFPQPVFAIKDAAVESVRQIGGGKHLRLAFDCGGRRLDGVWFNKSEMPGTRRLDIAFRAEINRFRGQEQPQLRLIDVRERGDD
jgi:single-stranded-DNA-specific exonuclease